MRKRVPIKYIASSGNTYDLVSSGIVHKDANYHNWKWKPEGTNLQHGMRVADFSKDPANYVTTLYIYGNPAHRRNVIDTLHDEFETDIWKKTPGKIIWGDYYLTCFINESNTVPTEYWYVTENKINIFAPYPFWMREVKISLPPSAVASGEFLDYPYNYPYDYTAPTVGTKKVKSTFPFESEFEMVIFGPVVNPRVTINGHPYVLYTTVPQGAYVVIRSREGTVMMYENNGRQTNVFDFRNKSASIFQKIPGGNLDITWDASFGVDLTIYHQRSEPRIEVI